MAVRAPATGGNFRHFIVGAAALLGLVIGAVAWDRLRSPALPSPAPGERAGAEGVAAEERPGAILPAGAQGGADAEPGPLRGIRPLPIRLGTKMVPSPFFLSLAEEEVQQRSSALATGAKPGSRELVLWEAISAVHADDVKAFQALAVPEERAAVPKLMKLHRMMFQGRRDPVVFRRFDYGGASYFVMEGGQMVPFSAMVVRKVEGRFYWSPKAIQDPLGEVLSDLVIALMQDPDAFAPVKGPFRASLSLMPLYGEQRANPVSLFFRHACRADFVAYDATGALSKSAGGCSEDVNAVLRFYRDTWLLLAGNQFPDFLKRFDLKSAQSIARTKQNYADFKPGGYVPTTLSAAGDVVGGEALVVLEPGEWVGKPWPLLRHIDVGGQLGSGEWRVLLYHDDCPKCRDLVPAYERQAGGPGGGARTALIAVPPFAAAGAGLVSAASPCLSGRLSDRHQWFVYTPTEVVLHDGLVTQSRELK